jgi:hypothetical protein
MRTASANLTAHLQGEVTSLAICWKLTLTNGTIMGFTDQTSDLTISAVLYIHDENNKDTFQTLLFCENAILEGKVSDKVDKMIDTASQILDRNEINIFVEGIDVRGA